MNRGRSMPRAVSVALGRFRALMRLRWHLETLPRDAGYAWRLLRSRPLSSAAAIATLAIGIGLNAAVFSVFDWVLIRPLPYPSPEDLVRVFSAGTAPVTGPADLTYSEFVLLSQAKALDASTAFSTATRVIDGPERSPAHVLVSRVGGDLFGTFGVRPAIGRGIDANEAASGATVVILSDTLWRRRFSANPEIAGRVITIDGKPHTINGVMPAGRGYPKEADLWYPLSAEERQDDDRELVMIGRLSSGTTAERAGLELTTLASAVPAAARRVWVENVQRTEVRDVRAALTALLAASALLLLIACANVAALIGARGADRTGELALRSALGASRARLFQQQLTESVLLAAVGGVAGLLLGTWTLDLLITLAPAGLPRLGEITLDGRVILIGAGATLLVGLAVGLGPSCAASRLDLRASLGATGSVRASGRTRVRRVLVGGQTAMAVVLTIGAGLLARSLQHLVTIDHGFAAEHLLAVDLYLRGSVTGDVRQLFRELVESAEAIPGVRSAAVAMRLPSAQMSGFRVSVGRVGVSTETFPATLRPVTARYFETAGIPILQGRPFTGSDTQKAPRVAIVNRTFVRAVLGGGEALGTTLASDIVEGNLSVVGVVADVTPSGARDRAALYVSMEQLPVGGSLLVRTDGDPQSIVPALTTSLRTSAPALARDRIYRVADTLEANRAATRFNTQLASAFASLALLLAAIGVYGLTAGEVAARWRELAIRLALGATRREALWTVMRPGAIALGVGAIAGVTAALGGGRWMTALLHGVEPADPPTLVGVPVLLCVVGLAAASFAALRVLRADPAVTLRGE